MILNAEIAFEEEEEKLKLKTDKKIYDVESLQKLDGKLIKKNSKKSWKSFGIFEKFHEKILINFLHF